MPSPITVCYKDFDFGYITEEELIDYTYITTFLSYVVYYNGSDEFFIIDLNKKIKGRTSFYKKSDFAFKIVGKCSFSNFKLNSKVLKIYYMRLDNKYLGKKLSIYFYKSLLYSGYTLCSGDEQSKGGEYIWKNLINDNDVIVSIRKNNKSHFKVSKKTKKIEETQMTENYKLIYVAKLA